MAERRSSEAVEVDKPIADQETLPIGAAGDESPSVYPLHREALPEEGLDHGRYRVCFAASQQQLDAVLRMRFQIFNLEMGEGLEASFARGRDEDVFDRQCHHLMVLDRQSDEIVGTYRLQTSEMASGGIGFYSAGEFDLGGLPDGLLENAVEVGRACITREYRNRHVLFLLWRGLALYLRKNRKRYLFGCCSLNSQDPAEGLRLQDQLAEEDRFHPGIRVEPLPGLACEPAAGAIPAASVERDELPPVHVPTLFRTYLRYGAKVCSSPAVDRDFRTIDFFVVLDIQTLDRRTFQIFFD